MKETKKEPKVAIVAEALDTLGGKEKNLRSILKVFPNATVYTVRSSKDLLNNKDFINEDYPKLKVKNSFIHYIPFEKYFRKELYLLYPLAYRTFSFLGYDIVISISDAFSHHIKPWSKKTKYIGYIITPPKFWWMKTERSIKDMQRFSYKFYRFFIGSFLEKIWLNWDRNAAKRMDYVLTQSKEVQKRIKDFYGLKVDEIIYPPVDLKNIKLVNDYAKRENWYLYFGRVETYKGVEMAIRACAMLHKPLKIAGIGSNLEDMKKLVKELNAKGIVKFLGYPNDEMKNRLFSKCKALLFPVEKEEFGIVPVEANAYGAAVIAYKGGGVKESISSKNPKTGVFFTKYNYESLAEAITKFDPDEIDPKNCRKQASQFANEIFEYKIKNFVNDVYQNSK